MRCRRLKRLRLLLMSRQRRLRSVLASVVVYNSAAANALDSPTVYLQSGCGLSYEKTRNGGLLDIFSTCCLICDRIVDWTTKLLHDWLRHRALDKARDKSYFFKPCRWKFRSLTFTVFGISYIAVCRELEMYIFGFS